METAGSRTSLKQNKTHSTLYETFVSYSLVLSLYVCMYVYIYVVIGSQ